MLLFAKKQGFVNLSLGLLKSSKAPDSCIELIGVWQAVFGWIHGFEHGALY